MGVVNICLYLLAGLVLGYTIMGVVRTPDDSACVVMTPFGCSTDA